MVLPIIALAVTIAMVLFVFSPQIKEVLRNWDRTSTVFAWIILIVIITFIVLRNIT